MLTKLILLIITSGIFIYFSLRLTWWRKNIDYKFPRVLMYHMISKHLAKKYSKFNRLRVKPNEFEKQLIWLKRNGFKSYFASEISPNLPQKSVIITFDDGYKDNFINAFRLLQKYNFKATIFIVLNRFDKNWATDKDLNKKSNELNAEEMLSNEDIKTMIQSGLIEIGSHTLNHPNLPVLNDEEKNLEIVKSKKEIENLFNIKCESFAYPFGFYDTKCSKIAKDAGYKVALTTHNDVYKQCYSNYEIPRIMISGNGNILHFILKIKKVEADENLLS